jgi:hypothetical protein
MTYRMWAASLVVLSGIGAAIGTVAAGTAPGAFVGAGAPPGGFHASGAAFGHPMGLHHFVARTRGDFFFFRGREHREERREGEFGRWPGLAGYFPYDYPVGSPAYYAEPPYRYAYPDSPATAPNVFRPPLQCDTASQTVPSEKGGVATINVTRCY